MLGRVIVLAMLAAGQRVAWASQPVRAADVASGIGAQAMAATEVKAAEHGGASSEAQAPAGGIPGLNLGSRLEITAGTNGLFSFGGTTPQASVFSEARFRLTHHWQIGGSFAYRFQSSDGTSSQALQGLIGPTLNLPMHEGGLADAFFFSAKAGLTIGKSQQGSVTLDSTSHSTVSFEAGKRFAFNSSIAYVPSIGVTKEFGASPCFTLQPVAISIFL